MVWYRCRYTARCSFDALTELHRIIRFYTGMYCMIKHTHRTATYDSTNKRTRNAVLRLSMAKSFVLVCWSVRASVKQKTPLNFLLFILVRRFSIYIIKNENIYPSIKHLENLAKIRAFSGAIMSKHPLVPETSVEPRPYLQHGSKTIRRFTMVVLSHTLRTPGKVLLKKKCIILVKS